MSESRGYGPGSPLQSGPGVNASGNWYVFAGLAGGTTTTQVSAASFLYSPFVPKSTFTLKNLTVHINTSTPATGYISLGVYSSNAAGQPGKLLGYATYNYTGFSGAAWATVAIPGSIKMQAGKVYWLGVIIKSTSGVQPTIETWPAPINPNPIGDLVGIPFTAGLVLGQIAGTMGYYSTDAVSPVMPATPTGLAIQGYPGSAEYIPVIYVGVL